MGLLICVVCLRQKILKPIPRRPFRCTNCGARVVRKVRRVKVWMDLSDKPGIDPEQARLQTYSGLLWFVHSRGYKIGWAAVKFRALTSSWPPREWSELEPGNVSLELMLWERKQQAAYAKMQRDKEKVAKAKPVEQSSPLMSEEDWMAFP